MHLLAPCLAPVVLGRGYSGDTTTCAGRQRTDGLECFVAVTTEAFAHALIDERPLTSEAGAYVPQTAEYLSAVAPRIWEQLCGLMGPFPGAQPAYRRVLFAEDPH